MGSSQYNSGFTYRSIEHIQWRRGLWGDDGLFDIHISHRVFFGDNVGITANPVVTLCIHVRSQVVIY